MNRKIRFINIILCAAAAAGIMTGCEKASDRTIFIEPPESIVTSAADGMASNGQPESIGAGELLKSISFSFEGIKMDLDKKPYSDFKEKGWTFDPAVYGLSDIKAELGSVYQRSIFLNKEGYDIDTFCIGVTNFRQEPCGIEDIQLWSVEFIAHGKTKYPQIIVNGGITWGSTKADIIKAYGEPNSIEKDADSGADVMHYTDNAGSDVYFTLYDNEGVGKITLEMYKA